MTAVERMIGMPYDVVPGVRAAFTGAGHIRGSTTGYVDREPSPVEGARAIAQVIRETASRIEKVLLPAFTSARTQEAVQDFHLLAREESISQIPIHVHSQLASNTTTMSIMHPEVYDQSEELVHTGYAREWHESITM